MKSSYSSAILQASLTLAAEPFAPWPFFAEDEIEAAVAVLRSGKVNYWTGEEGRRFEKEYAEFAACSYAVAVANGTVALELALRALGIGPGDEVITTSRTFIASASCVVAVGARPVFADVDRDSQNVTANTIRAAITSATRAIIPVHLAGWPCEMDEILELAREFDLKVVEDCAQAHGATFRGRPVGSWGDAAAFSFCQDKNLTTAGEGGMVTTNSEELWERMWSYKDHGKSYDTVHRTSHPPGFRWLHESFGTNWRMSEVQSAVGRVALRKLPGWIATRRHHAALLTRRLAQLPGLRIPQPPSHTMHAFYKYYAFVQPECLAEGWSRGRIAEAIAACGVPCSTGSCSEIYLEKAFPLELRPARRLPVARELGETSLMFLVHPTLSETHMERTCEAVEQVMLEATRPRSVACAAVSDWEPAREEA
jgi:dTDP-4-amino-4,6-dideoxygalactose transaminase